VNKRIRNLFCLLMGLLGFKSLAAEAQEMFLCADDPLKGESQDPVYTDCIDVLAWSWGMSNSGTSGSPGVANVQDLSFAKAIDKSSPDLMLGVVKGTVFPKVELFMRDTCPDACTDPFYELRMYNVLVTSVSTGANAGGGRPIENVSLNFGQVEWCYTPVLNGKPGTQECQTWTVGKLP